MKLYDMAFFSLSLAILSAYAMFKTHRMDATPSRKETLLWIYGIIFAGCLVVTLTLFGFMWGQWFNAPEVVTLIEPVVQPA
ncbi:MAG: hypothetical protein OQJ84_04185 [Xanthomonadales bacterium]|nr:hypothetical protein [Xanthomonadales bacterium]